MTTWTFETSPEELLKIAREAADRAYAPYSNFHVGAALLLETGDVVTGCNIENASYPLSICAERCAIAGMVARGKRSPLAVAVVGSNVERDDYFTIPCPPCGACRQTLSEFSSEVFVVLAPLCNPKIFEIRALLPHTFVLDPDSNNVQDK